MIQNEKVLDDINALLDYDSIKDFMEKILLQIRKQLKVIV